METFSQARRHEAQRPAPIIVLNDALQCLWIRPVQISHNNDALPPSTGAHDGQTKIFTLSKNVIFLSLFAHFVWLFLWHADRAGWCQS